MYINKAVQVMYMYTVQCTPERCTVYIQVVAKNTYLSVSFPLIVLNALTHLLLMLPVEEVESLRSLLVGDIYSLLLAT